VGSPTQPLYNGPFKILEKQLKTFLLEVGNRQESVSNRLKPHTGQAHVEVASPPRGSVANSWQDLPAKFHKKFGRQKKFSAPF
jgi:hypothetical protein